MSKKDEVRVNNKIRSAKIRLIDPDGNQIGIIPISQALHEAENHNLDLVEIVPNAKPPVCKIMDYGKYKYTQQKKEKKSKKKQHIIHIKELRMHPTIEEHDIQFKIKHARKFINQGDHLKIRIIFKGRQIVHPELGDALIKRIINEIEDIAQIEKEPVKEGKSLIVTFIPK